MTRADAFESITGERAKRRKTYPLIGCMLMVAVFIAATVGIGYLAGLAF